MQHLDVPNLRGRKEQESSRSDHEAESDEEFDFASAEEVGSGYRGSNQREGTEPADQGGDEAKKGKKTKTKTLSDVV